LIGGESLFHKHVRIDTPFLIPAQHETLAYRATADPESAPAILFNDGKRWPPNAQDHTLPFRYVIKMID